MIKPSVSAAFLDEEINMGYSIMEEISKPFAWTEVICFYEDSEGDLNVISEDEDFIDAMAYLNYKKVSRATKCVLTAPSCLRPSILNILVSLDLGRTP